MFVLDTSTFVQAQNHYYAQDIVPGFWNLIVSLHQNGTVISVDRVLGEINQFHNPTEPLRQWATGVCPASAFASCSDPDVVAVYSRLITWVTNQPQYRQSAVAEFARGADGWVMAYAKVKDHTVVSMEVSAPYSQKSAKMPDICSAHGINHVDTYEFLREVGARFS